MQRKKNKKNEQPIIVVKKGYTLEELLDTDSEGYGFENEEPFCQEEVIVRFGEK